MAPVANGQVVISQIYGGGGNSGARYQNDFVELFNRGAESVSLAGWSIQYSASAGVTWQVQNLNGALPAGRHFLIQLGSGGANGVPLPTADVVGTINMSATGGKVALVQTVVALAGNCPDSENIADLVGYGNAASCFEGAGPAAALSSALSAFRALNGCRDTGDNKADFFTSSPSPRNLQSDPTSCGVSLVLALHEIQGAGLTSDFVGQTITTTTNVITAVTSSGFFLQAPDGETDSDPDTSEAIYVSTPGGLPALAQVSNSVVVTAFVEESRPASDPAAPSRTQLTNPLLELVDVGQPLPSTETISAGEVEEASSLSKLERLEGMRVRVASLTVVGATEGFIQEAAAIGISDGVFYAVPTGLGRPMREPGIPLLDPLPAGAPAAVPRFDGNPERLRVDSNGQTGARRIEVMAGAVIEELTGVLDFQQRAWTLLPDVTSAHSVSVSPAAIPIAAAGDNEILVVSLNLQRFFDTEDDPEVSEAVLTPAAFEGRLKKASLTIREILSGPDILGVLEMENLSTLQALAERVNADLRSIGRTSPRYSAWLLEGNDIGGIDCGFLVNTARVEVIDVTQVGKSATYVNPLAGEASTLNDRPPLVLRAEVSRGGSREPLTLTVVLNHLRSMSAIDHPTDGERVRAKRRAQAEFLAELVQQRQMQSPAENIVVMGDFNAFQFNDGYVDLIGTIIGKPTPAAEVTLESEDLVNPDLVNLTELLPGSERYSYSFDGNAQAIDHIMVNAALRPRVARHGYARSNVDFPESFRSDFNRPERLSDHDAAVVWLSLNLQPAVLSLAVVDGKIELRLRGEPEQTVRIEISGDLVTWDDAGEVAVGSDGSAVFTAPFDGSLTRRFYRLAIP